MVKAQIQLDETKHQKLKSLAAQRSTSVSQLIREGIDRVLAAAAVEAARRRHGELIDKKFARSLSESESTELQAIEQDLRRRRVFSLSAGSASTRRQDRGSRGRLSIVSVFVRRKTPPTPSASSSYRPLVRQDFSQCCAYCLLHELLAGGASNFELDHFRPKSVFPHLAEDYFNLYYSCHVCNQYKSASWPSAELSKKGFGFVDFCKENFFDHFQERANGVWEPLTPSAEYTEARLRLNRPHLVEIRQLLRRLARLQGTPSISWDSPIRGAVLSWLL